MTDDKKTIIKEKAEAITIKALNRIEQALDDEEKSFQVNHLSSLLNILCDKDALTGDKAPSVAVEIKLPDNISDYAG